MAIPKQLRVILIAPIGTRDVALADLSLLPDHALQTAWDHADAGQRLGARTKGEILLRDLDRYAPALRLEILGKAVRHVVQKHGRIDQLVLVASDQPEGTPAKFRDNDTVEFARLIRELLRHDAQYKRVGDRTKIMKVPGNPADYETMRNFYRENLPVWCRDLAPDGICYLEVTGGTAQMGTMLLFEGMRLFRTRAAPLYVLEQYDVPLHLDLGRQILVDELVETLHRDLSVYAYHAAWKTCQEQEAILKEALPSQRLLLAVLDCARHRLNFDFAAAQSALFGAERGLPADLKARVAGLAHSLSETARTTAWLIREVFYNAAIQLRIEAYATFVGQVFRFQEAMLRYLCEQWGARFSTENLAMIDPNWLAACPTLRESLLSAGIAVDRAVSRAGLGRMALHLAYDSGNAQGEDWVKRLSRFEQVASLRNQLVITHGFEGVSLKRLRDLYRPGGAEQILADMHALVEEALVVPVAANPFDEINTLCLDLLEAH